MQRHIYFECPECGSDISDTYEPCDPDSGLSGPAGFYCEECDLAWTDDDE